MKLAVTSASFSKNKELCHRLKELWDGDISLNVEGIRFKEDELLEFLAGCDAAIVGLDKIHPGILDKLPQLKVISKFGVGLDNIDLEECKRRNISIGWTGGVNKVSVAEMALGFSLSLMRNLYQSSSLLSDGTWKKNGGSQLTGKKIGIIGFGHVGKEFYRLLEPFECEVMVNDIDPSVFDKTDVKNTELNTIFETADLISLHVPFTAKTENLITLEVMKKMKQKPILINTARGGIINEEDIIRGLNEGYISSVGIDAYLTEPHPSPELTSRNDVFCTPHIGGNAHEAVMAMGNSAIDNLLKATNSLEMRS